MILSLTNIVTAMAPSLLPPPQDADGGGGAEDTLFQVFVFVGVMGAGLMFDAGHLLWRRYRRGGRPLLPPPPRSHACAGAVAHSAMSKPLLHSPDGDADGCEISTVLIDQSAAAGNSACG